jgi:hypothetical protein
MQNHYGKALILVVLALCAVTSLHADYREFKARLSVLLLFCSSLIQDACQDMALRGIFRYVCTHLSLKAGLTSSRTMLWEVVI